MLDFVLQLLHQTDINKGHRSGEACRCLMTIAQSHTGREMLVTRTDEMFPSMMKLLKARNGEEQATLVHVSC